MAQIQVANIQRKMCDQRFSGAVGALVNGYFVIGATASGQHSLVGRGVGMDYVWDLWNEQFAAFVYGSLSANSSVFAGASAGGYIGFGSGRFGGVQAAWSGKFVSAQYSLDMSVWRVLGISAQAQGFSSPDGQMRGGLVGLSASAAIPGSLRHLLKLPVGVTINAAAGHWAPLDAATRLQARGRRVLSQGGGAYVDLRSNNSLGVASHILAVAGANPLTMGVASYAAAVSLIKSRQSGQCTVAS